MSPRGAAQAAATALTARRTPAPSSRHVCEQAGDVGDLGRRGDLIVGHDPDDLPVKHLLLDEASLQVEDVAAGADDLNGCELGALRRAQ